MEQSALKARRLLVGKTQQQVAKEANIPFRTYQDIEYGANSRVIRNVIKIADALGVTDLRELWALNNKPLSS